MKNIAIIVAHSDDETISMGGTIARLCADPSNNVRLLLISDSQYSNWKGEIHRTDKEVTVETKEACKALGLENRYDCLGYLTKHVPFDSRLIERIDQFLCTHKIDTVFTHAPDDYHQDHQNVGKAVLSASRRIQGNVYVFEPMFPAKSMSLFQQNFYIDVTPYFKTKMKALKAHTSQYKKYGAKWLDMAEATARLRGFEIGVQYAEAFCVIKQTLVA